MEEPRVCMCVQTHTYVYQRSFLEWKEEGKYRLLLLCLLITLLVRDRILIKRTSTRAILFRNRKFKGEWR